jgi:hypothetical protein
MEMDCFHYLNGADQDPGLPALWDDATASRSDVIDWLITGAAKGHGRNANEVAAELGRVWEQRLRYNYRAAHTVVQGPDECILLAVTQIAPDGFWVTVRFAVSLI